MNQEKKRIVFVTSLRLFPITGGGSTRVLGLVDRLREYGFSVELVTVASTSDERTRLNQRFDKVYVDPGRTNRTPLESKNQGPVGFVKMLGVPVKLVRRILRKLMLHLTTKIGTRESLISRNRNAWFDEYASDVIRRNNYVAVIAVCVWTSRCFDDTQPNYLRIIDTIDVQHLRAKTALRAGHRVDRFFCSRKEEVKELSRADVLLAIQVEEGEILKKMCPETKVLVVEHFHPIVSSITEPSEQFSILFVGNLYEPNIIGLKTFLDTAWKDLKGKVPQVTMDVCGRVCEAFSDKYQDVTFHGVVESLSEYYQRSTIVVNPVTFGTGLKIKSVEALAYGKCLVTTISGLTGLPVPTEKVPYCIVTRIEEMGGEIAHLLLNPSLRRNHEEAGLQFVSERRKRDTDFLELASLISSVPSYY